VASDWAAVSGLPLRPGRNAATELGRGGFAEWIRFGAGCGFGNVALGGGLVARVGRGERAVARRAVVRMISRVWLIAGCVVGAGLGQEDALL
jgi:hypothetical protein